MSVLLLFVICIVGNGITGFMSMELMFIVVLASVWLSSSTYERGGALSYLWFFSLLVRFGLIMMFDLNLISVGIVLVILAKLPLVGIHM